MIKKYEDGSVEVRTKLHKCPRCGSVNDNDLPVVVGDGVENGGCELCYNEDADQTMAAFERHDFELKCL